MKPRHHDVNMVFDYHTVDRTRWTNSRSNISCHKNSCTCSSCANFRKLGRSTAAMTPPSVVRRSSNARQQPQAATNHKAAAATYRATRPRKQPGRASLRHCSAACHVSENMNVPPTSKHISTQMTI